MFCKLGKAAQTLMYALRQSMCLHLDNVESNESGAWAKSWWANHQCVSSNHETKFPVIYLAMTSTHRRRCRRPMALADNFSQVPSFENTFWTFHSGILQRHHNFSFSFMVTTRCTWEWMKQCTILVLGQRKALNKRRHNSKAGIKRDDTWQVSGCGSVGRAFASDTRGPQFESNHRHYFIRNIIIVCCWKDENKRKRGREWSNFE